MEEDKPLDGDFSLSPALEFETTDMNQTFANLSLELIKNITNQLDQSKSGLENSDNKINETELYENGQTAKENNERSFIFINQKFKSPWFNSQRSLTRKSLFSSDENSDHFEEVANKFSVGFESIEQVLNDFRQTAKPAVQKVLNPVPSINLPPPPNTKHNQNQIPSQSNPNKARAKNPAYAHNKAFYNPVLVVPTHAEDNREYVELLKRPLVRPVAIPTNSRTNIRYPEPEPYKPFERLLLERHFFNDDEDSVVPRLAVQNQNHVQNKVNYGAQSQPQRISTVVSSNRVDSTRNIFDFKFNFDTTNRVSESKEEDEKLDQYLRSTLRGEASLRGESYAKIKEGSYDCYNSSCRRLYSKNNMQRLNNGVLLGLNCVCEEGSTKDRLIRKNGGNLKDTTGSHPHPNTTEVNDSDEKAKEPVSFSKLNEQSDVKAPHVNKTECFYSGWFQPKCSNIIKM
ncbi:hypothetical protein MSG28_006988 [Choristoneura fumiferana]|uniref:Uncharacterized protein n=1 Tax=Choristoneura fumiferana TaxID=7141 RepID=A0ACC0JM43_CHOFU|nr:hypothetical protein MSG28_006988 [Choristoneura fumiferana]